MNASTDSLVDSELTGRAQPSRTLAAYAQLVGRVRTLIERTTPEGAVVAVINKGDPALLSFRARHGMHFPQTPSGEYAGHHPADIDEIVERLRAAQAAGATHLAIPQTSAWWLDHYAGLRDLLEREATLLESRPEVGHIYALRTTRLASADDVPPAPRSDREASQLAGFLATLLPERSTTLVAATADVPAPEIAGHSVWSLRIDGSAGTPLIRAVEDLRARGAQFLVVPAVLDAHVSRHQAFHRRLTRTYPLVIHQHHVCAVYDLRGGKT